MTLLLLLDRTQEVKQLQASIKVTAVEITLTAVDVTEEQLLSSQVGKTLSMTPGGPGTATYIVKAV